MVARRLDPSAEGVPLIELRSAVALAHARVTDDALLWSFDQWSRLWIRLTPSMQRVVYLHVLVGLTKQEAAAQLGVSRASVHGLFNRALERLRDAVHFG